MKRVYAKKTKESKAAKVRVEGDCALAEAIETVLDQPPAPERLRARSAMFSVEPAVDRYLAVLLPLADAGREAGHRAEHPALAYEGDVEPAR